MKSYPILLSVPMTDTSILWEDMVVHRESTMSDALESLEEYDLGSECDKEGYTSLYQMFVTYHPSSTGNNVAIFDTGMYDQSYPQYIALLGFDSDEQAYGYLTSKLMTDISTHPLHKIIGYSRIPHRGASIPFEVLFPEKES